MKSHVSSWGKLALLFIVLNVDIQKTRALYHGVLTKGPSAFILPNKKRCPDLNLLLGQELFSTSQKNYKNIQSCLWSAPTAGSNANVATIVYPFIETELRGAAMKLHTRSQAPKEGKVEDKKPDGPRYVPTHDDYLSFLVDSKHVYEAFEEAVKSDSHPELTAFQDTKLERTKGLEEDIQFLVKEYNLIRPEVGLVGKQYSEEVRRIIKEKDTVPQFMCHFYNFYFAHTAGGRMIGKKMAQLLLDKKILEFYKWDGDLDVIKHDVKTNIEALAVSWSKEEKAQCVDTTAAAFRFGGALNSYFSGRNSIK